MSNEVNFNLLQELQKEIAKTKTLEQAEKTALDFICRQDFTDSEIRKQAIEYCKRILNIIEKGQEIKPFDVKIMQCILTKIHLADINLDISFTYISQDEAVKTHRMTEDALGFYDRYSNTIYFINEKLQGALTSHITYGLFAEDESLTNTQKVEFSKFRDIVWQLITICHEAEHAIQQRDSFGIRKMDNYTQEGYIMDKENAARECSLSVSSKYNGDEIYRINHDEFYLELDANEKGYDYTLKMLEELSPTIYKVAIGKHKEFDFKTKKENLAKKKENYHNVNWSHATNPNNAPVSASHKASIILDTLLPKLSISKRKELFENIPSLQITYNLDGSKKSLEQVEREREANINRLLVTENPEEVKKKVPKLIKIYETAIESDAVLSFERCMRQIAMLSWDETCHYTKDSEALDNDQSKVIAELNATVKKAKKLATYIEEVDYKIVKRIFAKCKKDLETTKKTNQRDKILYNKKKRAIYDIESSILHNRDFVTLKIEGEKEFYKKMMDEKYAEEIIKKVFPNFNPQNVRFEGILNGTQIKEVNNVDEKLLLMESLKRYVQDSGNYQRTKHKFPIVKQQDLYVAIRTFYDFDVSDEQKQEFERKLKNGEIKLLRNIYTDDGYLERKQELLPHRTKPVEPVKKEEIKRAKVKEQTTTVKPKEEKKVKVEEEYDEYGVKITPKNQTTSKDDEQAVRSAQQQQEEYVRQQDYDRGM